jgi:FAD/FMN-containing dehydrogenase
MKKWTSEGLDNFSKSFNGKCLVESASEFEAARSVYNAAVTKRPNLILQCTSQADICQAVKFARSHVQFVSVKGGGHNLAGVALNHEGITIDVSPMRQVEVDLNNNVAIVQGAARLGDIDSKTSQYGVAVPLGTVSDTGVGGLALGGGIGWLMPRYGLTCDNIKEVQLVDSNGDVLVANSSENADLFWGLCGGGGGNYGIVSTFRFNLVPVSTVFAGSILFGVPHADKAFDILSRINKEGGLDICAMLSMIDDARFGACLSLDFCSLDATWRAGQFRDVWLKEAPVLAHKVERMPLVEWQRLFDGAALRGFRRYAKSVFLDELPEALVNVLCRRFESRPSRYSSIFIEEFHGVFSDGRFAASAFGNRDAKFNLHVQGCWQHESEDQKNILWLKELVDEVRPYSRTQGSYVNYNSDLSRRARGAYTEPVMSRLLELKKKYDPTDFFRGTLGPRAC